MSKISFVIPCYYSEKTLVSVVEELLHVMSESMKGYSYEVIMINDGSKDKTFDVIKQLCCKYGNMKGINFSRNFGQHAALMAGFRESEGELVICLDDDGQMPLESIPDMVHTTESGYDVTFGRYEKKMHSGIKNTGSRINQYMCRTLLEKPDDIEMNSFWCAKKFVIDEMIKYGGAYPYIAGLMLRVTRNMTNIDVKHRSRQEGQTGYSLKKLFALWMNGFTAFSIKPLRIATFLGMICSVIGFIYGIVTVLRKIINPDILLGYSSLVTIIMFIGGIIMLMLGMIGEYIGRIYICINNSPQYVIKDVVRSKTDNVNKNYEKNL